MINKTYLPLLSFLMLLGAIYLAFDQQIVKYHPDGDISKDQFSVDRALSHLKVIAQKPHFVGTNEHTKVRNYLTDALGKMGLKVTIQEQEVFNSKWKGASKVYNVLAKIEGTDTIAPALLLLSHYDSAPHSKSLGASDAGSGVVAILESVRAFLASEQKPKNDIIILFSDAEELGLLGAKAFVEDHPWTAKVGLVLNLEARGSGGPSYMFLETNAGNEKLIQAFNKAKIQKPVGNSLIYSIYKLLPNDTDLTVFRANANIDGFNFAFIDDHFDYHSAQDTYERLDRNSLAQQGEYMFKLLNYFSQQDLSALKSKKDRVFFNFPWIGIISYPFSWVLPFILCISLCFLLLFYLGIQKKRISFSESFRGFVPLLLALVAASLIGFFGWKLILLLSPAYAEILQGYTYNGKWIVLGFIALTITLFLSVYKRHFERKRLPDLLMAPMVVWIMINLWVAINLTGASFLVIPLLGLLIAYFLLIVSNKISEKSMPFFTLLSLPGLMIIAPLLTMLPVGLGLKMLVVTTVLTVLILSTLISSFDFYHNHKSLIRLFLAITILTFSAAYLNGKYDENQRLPDSIIFYQDVEKNQAFWASYDQQPDNFTEQFLGKTPEYGNLSIPFGGKYQNKIRRFKPTSPLNCKLPIITKTINDSLFLDKTIVEFSIQSSGNSSLYYIQTNSHLSLYQMSINGVETKFSKAPEESLQTNFDKGEKIVSYYLAAGVNHLSLQMTIPKNQVVDLDLYDISLDLLENQNFKIVQRPLDKLPKPFVINDAVVLKMKLLSQ